jgi:hypothetical protein
LILKFKKKKTLDFSTFNFLITLWGEGGLYKVSKKNTK